MLGMGKVERLMIEAMARHPEGLTPEEALDAIVPPDNPKLRFRPAYKYCFDRLASRHMVDFVFATELSYYIPSTETRRYVSSDKAMAELGTSAPE